MYKFICRDCSGNEFKDVKIWKDYYPEVGETVIRTRMRCANLDCCLATGYSYVVKDV